MSSVSNERPIIKTIWFSGLSFTTIQRTPDFQAANLTSICWSCGLHIQNINFYSKSVSPTPTKFLDCLALVVIFLALHSLWRSDAWAADLCCRTGQTLAGLQAGQRLVAGNGGQGATKTFKRRCFLFTWKRWHMASTHIFQDGSVYLQEGTCCTLVRPLCAIWPGLQTQGLGEAHVCRQLLQTVKTLPARTEETGGIHYHCWNHISNNKIKSENWIHYEKISCKNTHSQTKLGCWRI